MRPRPRARPISGRSPLQGTGRSPPKSSAHRTSSSFAEEYHQQYLAKNPGGYCGLGGTGVACPSGLGGR
jgi:hypothetical protein